MTRTKAPMPAAAPPAAARVPGPPVAAGRFPELTPHRGLLTNRPRGAPAR